MTKKRAEVRKYGKRASTPKGKEHDRQESKQQSERNRQADKVTDHQTLAYPAKTDIFRKSRLRKNALGRLQHRHDQLSNRINERENSWQFCCQPLISLAQLRAGVLEPTQRDGKRLQDQCTDGRALRQRPPARREGIWRIGSCLNACAGASRKHLNQCAGSDAACGK